MNMLTTLTFVKDRLPEIASRIIVEGKRLIKSVASAGQTAVKRLKDVSAVFASLVRAARKRFAKPLAAAGVAAAVAACATPAPLVSQGPSTADVCHLEQAELEARLPDNSWDKLVEHAGRCAELVSAPRDRAKFKLKQALYALLAMDTKTARDVAGNLEGEAVIVTTDEGRVDYVKRLHEFLTLRPGEATAKKAREVLSAAERLGVSSR